MSEHFGPDEDRADRLQTYSDVNGARWAAIHRLLDLHRDEYDRIHAEEREARGLHPKPKTIPTLEARVRQLEAELAQAKGQS